MDDREFDKRAHVSMGIALNQNVHMSAQIRPDFSVKLGISWYVTEPLNVQHEKYKITAEWTGKRPNQTYLLITIWAY